jgi:hypothetical protein
VIGKNYANDANIKKLVKLWEDPRIQTYLKQQAEPALFPVDAKPTSGPEA